MNRSLERHLSRSLALAITLTGLAAGIASFAFAYMDAQELQDDTLRQIAALSDSGGNGPAFEDDTGLRDPESRVIVLHLPRDHAPVWMPSDLQAGFHTLVSAEGRFRVFVRSARGDTRIAVAQPTDSRDENAIDSALRTIVPMAMLLILLLWISRRIIRRNLGSVRRLSQTLDEASAERPRALPDVGVPEEITPFVHAINRLLERVTRLVADQRRFVADAAHELRSPLTALSLQVENLEKTTSLEEARRRIVPLREGIERARRLTEQLLSLASLQAGAKERVPVDLSRMARELIADFLPLAEKKKIDLGLDEAVEDLVFNSDPKGLGLILRNGLDNALRHTPERGEVTIHIFLEGDGVVLEIMDTGPGIAEGELENAFGPFHRLAGADGGGSGLGLAIAREAATSLGGVLSLHSRLGGSGTVFRYSQA